jgi:ABC-type transport system involved in Fe-S cluster assembly fused permease/ATPase subunit
VTSRSCAPRLDFPTYLRSQVYIIGAGFVYLYYVITLYEWADSPAPAHAFIWTLSLIGEAIILVLSILTVTGPRWVLQDVRTSKYARHTRADGWDQVDLGIATLRLVLVAGLVLSYAALAWKRQRKVHGHYVGHEARTAFNRNEATPLLGNEGPDYLTQNRDEHENQHPVDSEVSSMDGVSERDLKVVEADGDGFYRPKKLPVKSWWEYCRDYAIFFPYLWPSTVPRLQGAVLICFVLLLLQRVVNLLVPFQIGIVTDSLESGEEPRHMPWAALSLLVVYKLLQGPSGALGSLRTILWIPVSQHTYRALITAAFQHVHSLSLDFHLKKRTGEIQSALNKGGAINQFLEQVTFQVFPMILDLLIAIVFFYVNFNAMYALFVSIITFFYLHLTIRMAATRAQQRREMTNADRDEEAIKNESIQSYETIKYFNAEQFEFDKYGAAIDKFQTAEAQVILGTSHMNVCQALVFLLGILVAMLLGAYEVTMGKRTVGDFVLLITYLQQLQGPLNYFGSFYRTVQQAMISGERLLELFKYQPSVIDEPGACALVNPEGYVRFENVGFYYDERKPALHDLSFDCKPGTTTAFVGESGGGKSTIFRLMFRYYNPTEGRLESDGKDVRGLTIDSVRRAIGVVPQDTTLFNETIMYNLRYAKPDATDDEVFDACRAAAIHDRIMHFPDGYKTIVGERGLRLRGGEKQRVAIARTILKNPKIIMLDEATSALDGETESEIHARMNSGNWGKDRTLLIIA